MSRRSLDKSGRWRNITVGFRVSPEESKRIDALVALSGLTKQEYIISRLEEKDVVVKGSLKVFKALKDILNDINEKLKKLLDQGEKPDPELLNVIEACAQTLEKMSENYSETN